MVERYVEVTNEYVKQLEQEIDNLKKINEEHKKINGKLQQENKQLKENYERIYNENCKLREEHNITDISLLDENQQLKKQLEEKENIACNWKDSCLENAGKIEILENQQKSVLDEIREFVVYEKEYAHLNRNTPNPYYEYIEKQMNKLLQILDKAEKDGE